MSLFVSITRVCLTRPKPRRYLKAFSTACHENLWPKGCTSDASEARSRPSSACDPRAAPNEARGAGGEGKGRGRSHPTGTQNTHSGRAAVQPIGAAYPLRPLPLPGTLSPLPYTHATPDPGDQVINFAMKHIFSPVRYFQVGRI